MRASIVSKNTAREDGGLPGVTRVKERIGWMVHGARREWVVHSSCSVVVSARSARSRYNRVDWSPQIIHACTRKIDWGRWPIGPIIQLRLSYMMLIESSGWPMLGRLHIQQHSARAQISNKMCQRNLWIIYAVLLDRPKIHRIALFTRKAIPSIRCNGVAYPPFM